MHFGKRVSQTGLSVIINCLQSLVSERVWGDGSVVECLMLLQMTEVQLPASTWWLCNSSSRGSGAFFQPPWVPGMHRHTCRQQSYTFNKNKKQNPLLSTTKRPFEMARWVKAFAANMTLFQSEGITGLEKRTTAALSLCIMDSCMCTHTINK